MNSHRRTRGHCFLLLIGLAFSAEAGIFDDPKNLKVLPKDISPQQLRQTMRGFSLDLGLNCESCHVGEAGQPIETFDFAADSKVMKETARLMLRMVADINDRQLASLDRAQDERVSVRCATCHRGQPRPLTIGDELELAYVKGGTMAAIERYRTLKAENFGSDSYDFTERPRLEFAGQLVNRQDVAGSIEFLRALRQEHGASYVTDLTLGNLYLAEDDRENAIEAFEAAKPSAPPAVRENIEKHLEGLKPGRPDG